MVDFIKAEKLINEYVKCWEKQGLRSPNNIVEDCDFGAENLQLGRNGFLFEYFSYDELSRLPALLIRELKGQINHDHKYFWAYIVFLTYNLRKVKLFDDHDWQLSFSNLVHLVLSKKREIDRTKIKDVRTFMIETETQQIRLAMCVNYHSLETLSNKWEISAPLAFSVLEGLLRRKNPDYVNTDGTIKVDFDVINPKTGKKSYGKKGKPLLNRIGDCLRCYEQLTMPKQNKSSKYLQGFKTEVCSLYSLPSTADVYEIIDNWRNDLVHGKEY